MAQVKFLETRNYRASPSALTIKYERGKTYPFQPHMRAFIDIGHAELIDGDATPSPAAIMPPSAMAKKPKAPATAQPQSAERSIPDAARRDPVKNGGFSEA